MILLREGARLTELVATLEGSGVFPVWSEVSQTVYLTDFVKAKRIPLEEALRRVLPDDPRRTPWLDRLSDFYRAGDDGEAWNILYVPSTAAARALRVLSRNPETAERVYPGGTGGSGFGFLWLPGVCLALFLASRAGSARYFVLAAAIPWLSLWFSNRPAAALAGIWAYLVLVGLGMENEQEPGRILKAWSRETARRVLPVGLVFVLLAVADWRSLPGFLASVLSAGCLVLFLENFYLRRAERCLHKVFLGPPLDLLKQRRDRDKRWRRRLLAAFAASGIALGVQTMIPVFGSLSGLGQPGALKLPAPGPAAASGSLDAETVEGILRARPQAGLPNLADAVAHRAYQEALPYSRIGTREYGSLAPAVLERFSSDGITVARTRETVLEFDDSWVRTALREEESSGIGAVLAGQRGIATAQIRGEDRIWMPQSLALKDVFFYIILLAPGAFDLIYPFRRRKPSFGGIARGASRR